MTNIRYGCLLPTTTRPMVTLSPHWSYNSTFEEEENKTRCVHVGHLGFITLSSCLLLTTTGPMVTLSLFYKKHRIPLLLKKKKTKFQLYCVHGLTAIWACKIVKLIKFYCYSGFHVANSIYSMLKNSPGVFNPLEVRISNIVKALIITRT